MPPRLLLVRKPHLHQPHLRPFLTTTTPPQTLTATRSLPYAPAPLYTLISDIDSYASFVPYCTRSTVTQRDVHGQPTQATLHVGWGSITESFASRVRCQPHNLVEARGEPGAVFRSLITRWTFREAEEGRGGTVVKLDIRFEFANPVYAVLSAAVRDSVAAMMVEAFENHARKMLGGKEGGVQEGRSVRCN